MAHSALFIVWSTCCNVQASGSRGLSQSFQLTLLELLRAAHAHTAPLAGNPHEAVRSIGCHPSELLASARSLLRSSGVTEGLFRIFSTCRVRSAAGSSLAAVKLMNFCHSQNTSLNHCQPCSEAGSCWQPAKHMARQLTVGCVLAITAAEPLWLFPTDDARRRRLKHEGCLLRYRCMASSPE